MVKNTFFLFTKLDLAIYFKAKQENKKNREILTHNIDFSLDLYIPHNEEGIHLNYLLLDNYPNESKSSLLVV